MAGVGRIRYSQCEGMAFGECIDLKAVPIRLFCWTGAQKKCCHPHGILTGHRPSWIDAILGAMTDDAPPRLVWIPENHHYAAYCGTTGEPLGRVLGLSLAYRVSLELSNHKPPISRWEFGLATLRVLDRSE